MITPEAHGLLGVEASGDQQEVARHRDADVGGQHRGVGGVDDAAQQLGRPERGAVARHADVGHHRDEESAGLADPVHRGDHRGPAVADGEEREHLVAEVRERFVAFVGAAAQVAAGREDVARTGDDHGGEIRIPVHEMNGSLDAEVHGRRKGVARLGPVDDAPADDPVALEPQSGGAQVVRHCTVPP